MIAFNILNMKLIPVEPNFRFRNEEEKKYIYIPATGFLVIYEKAQRNVMVYKNVKPAT